MKAREYQIMEKAVSVGVEIGLNRAYKHSDSPTGEQIAEEIERAVMNEICEWFEFDTGIELDQSPSIF